MKEKILFSFYVEFFLGWVFLPEVFSSYLEYLNQVDEKICEYEEMIELVGEKYKKFVEDGISYQREMAMIKKLIFE